MQGKGLAAVQTASVVLGAFREAAYDAPDLAAIAARIELSLERQAADEEFVTAVLAQVQDGGPAIEILNCGHPAPLLLSGGAAGFIDPVEPGLPLGLAQLCVSTRETRTIDLALGEGILFYTDLYRRNQRGTGQVRGVLPARPLPRVLRRLGSGYCAGWYPR